MRQTWRWFNPPDRTSVDDMLQAGTEGVVFSLHHIETGAEWEIKEIITRQEEIARMADSSPSGLRGVIKALSHDKAE